MSEKPMRRTKEASAKRETRVGTKKRPITVPIPYYPGRLGPTNSAHTTHPPLREVSRNEDHVLLSCPWCGKTEVIEH